MHRRHMIGALACWPAGVLLAQLSQEADPLPPESPRPRHRISAGRLYEALDSRFPVRVGFGRLLQLKVSAPGLLLLPTRNRLGATLLMEISGHGMQPVPGAEADLAFAVRYEPADRTLRAYDAEILALRWPGLPPQGAEALQRVLPGVARDAVRELVLHRFTPGELALPDTMGFEPEAVTVLEDGVEILFRPKSRP